MLFESFDCTSQERVNAFCVPPEPDHASIDTMLSEETAVVENVDDKHAVESTYSEWTLETESTIW